MIECMVFENKKSHVRFPDEELNLKLLLMNEYGLKHRDVDEIIRLPLKRFFKTFKHPLNVKFGHKKIRFVS